MNPELKKLLENNAVLQFLVQMLNQMNHTKTNEVKFKFMVNTDLEKVEAVMKLTLEETNPVTLH